MKRIMILLLALMCVGITVAFVAVSWQSHRSPNTPQRRSLGAWPVADADVGTQPTMFPDIRDSGTNAVVRFYRMLLQQASPSLADEEALFMSSSVRGMLVDAGTGSKSDPVVMQWCRKHKNQFIPANMASVDRIDVSGTFRFVQSLTQEKEPRNSDGYVVAIFPEDAGARRTREVTIVFDVNIEHGKINPEGIRFGGFGGRGVLEEVIEEKHGCSFGDSAEPQR